MNGGKVDISSQILAFLRFVIGPLFIAGTFLLLFFFLKKILGKDNRISSIMKNIAAIGRELLAKLIAKSGISRIFSFSGRRIIKSRKNGYEEEVERLILWRDLGKNYADRLKEWFSKMMEREKKWGELESDAERIRFLYRKMLIHAIVKGYGHNPADTPRETIWNILLRKNAESSQNKEKKLHIAHIAHMAHSAHTTHTIYTTHLHNTAQTAQTAHAARTAQTAQTAQTAHAARTADITGTAHAAHTAYEGGSKPADQALVKHEMEYETETVAEEAAAIYEKYRYGFLPQKQSALPEPGREDSTVQRAREIFSHELKL